MSKESFDAFDRLDPRVREALRYSLAPWHAGHLVGLPVDKAIAMIDKWDREQHVNAALAGVVASCNGRRFGCGA